MEFIVYLMIFVFILYITLVFYLALFQEREQVLSRLNQVKMIYRDKDEEDDEMRLPFMERVVIPLLRRIGKAITSVTPKSIRSKYDRLLVLSGKDKTTSSTRLLSKQMVFAFVIGGILYLVFNLMGSMNYLLIFVGAAIGFALPLSRINSGIAIRQKKIQQKLPDLLDLLYVTVEAGLGFDAAIKKSTEKMPGPLSEELNIALDEITKGKNRQEALRAVATRTGVEDLNNFITAIIQSEQLGTNVANMLRIQSNTMRIKRRQRAEEAAMKIPIKMLFPLIFFMFPSLFIVILGPAGINIVDVLFDVL